jgi:hypothetical protein
MKSLVFCSTLLLTSLINIASSPPAQAQRARVFVASYGNDSNPCTFLSPCRTFQQAVNVVASGGEVTAIDSAGFGSVAINQSVTITSPSGVEAGIAAPSGGTAVTISAGASGEVALRGLTIEGGGTGQTGISLLGAKKLVIENCIVSNLTSSGIALTPASASNITISNTRVSNNGGHGIYIQPPETFANVNALFNRVETYHNGLKGIGIFGNLDPNIDAIVVDSVAAFNESGIYALGDTVSGVGVTNVRVFRSATFQNGTPPFVGQTGQGVRAEGWARITVAQSHIEDDGWSIDQFQVGNNGSQIFSYDDNYSFNTTVPNGLLNKN